MDVDDQRARRQNRELVAHENDSISLFRHVSWGKKPDTGLFGC